MCYIIRATVKKKTRRNGGSIIFRVIREASLRMWYFIKPQKK